MPQQSPDEVRVQDKNGEIWYIPRSQLAAAAKLGAKPYVDAKPGMWSWETIGPKYSPAYEKMRSTAYGRFAGDLASKLGLDPDKIATAETKGEWPAWKETMGEAASGAKQFLQNLVNDPTEALASIPEGLARNLESARTPGEFMGALTSIAMVIEGPKKVSEAARIPARGNLGIGKTGMEIAFRKIGDLVAQARAADLTVREVSKLSKGAEGLRSSVRKVFDKRWDALREAIGSGARTNWAPVKAAVLKAEQGIPADQVPVFRRILKEGGEDFIDDTGGGTTRTAGVPVDIPYAKAQGYYTKLGKLMSNMERGPVWHALSTVQDAAAEVMQATADEATKSNPTGPDVAAMSKQLKADYTEFKRAFDDPDAPIRQLIDAETSPAKANVLKKFRVDDTVANLMAKYQGIVGGPDLASTARMLTDRLESTPHPGPIPDKPTPEQWRREQVRKLAEMYTHPTRLDVSMLGGSTGPLRRLEGWLLHKQPVEDWLAGEVEQGRRGIRTTPFPGPTAPTPAPEPAPIGGPGGGWSRGAAEGPRTPAEMAELAARLKAAQAAADLLGTK